MKLAGRSTAFTMAELLVSLAASVVVVGGLLLGSIGLHKTLHETEALVSRYADQRRVIDYLSRDLRRSITIASKDPSGLPTPVAGQSITVTDGAMLLFTLPGYYKSDVPAEADYTQPFQVITTNNGVAYGDASGAASEVIVWFKKVYVPEEGCVCFVRKESTTQEVIVRDAEQLNIRVHFADDAKSCDIEAWFRTPIRGHQQVHMTHDRVLLRNSSEDFE